MENKIVGVMGGLGPQATVNFLQLLVEYANAKNDQENLNLIVNMFSSTPDRTAYILDNKKENPSEKLIESAVKLEKDGCDFIVMPCNTATYFYNQIKSNIQIPFLNIVDIALEKVKQCKKVGLIATTGTIQGKVYNQNNIFIPREDIQNKIMNLIYEKVKKNISVEYDEFNEILLYFKNNGCDKVIAACTEISVIVEKLEINDEYIVDSLKELAIKTVKMYKE